MSVSMHSETSRDDIETEDTELEDLVWNLMSRTGLLSQIQGQISKFIEDNGNLKDTIIHPDRADGKILGCILEYLQWVGMKHTTSVLLSEAPVEVDASVYESRVEGPDYKPELCKLFDDHNTTEEKGSNTHNYSRDEFEDSRLTSGSGHHSIKSENGEESLSANVSGKINSVPEDKPVPQQILPASQSLQSNVSGETPKAVPDEISSGSSADKLEKKKDDLNVSVDMISFNSPMVPKVSEIRPHVTLRQKAGVTDLFAGSGEAFIEPSATLGKPTRLGFAQGSSLDDIARRESPVKEVIPRPDQISGSASSSLSPEEFSSGKSGHQKGSIDQPKSKQSNPHKQLAETKDAQSLEDDSTSDLMDALTMEDDTQDASIDSDAKGMSSCEHAVDLKK